MKDFLKLCCCVLVGLSAGEVSLAEETVLPLWPDAVPGESDLPAEFQQRVEELAKKNVPDRVFGVIRPTLTVFPAPAERANGAAVLVCPGGGYNVLAWGHEGRDVANWLNSLGIHAFVLTYRVPRRPGDFALPPLQDAQRAMRLIRSNAEAMKIDSQRVGVLGFSAGGNLAVNVGTRFQTSSYDPVDEADKLSCRPDFMIPIYAAYLGADDDDQQLNPGLKINSETPPTFMAVTQDDKNRGIHAALLFAKLTRVGVKAEVHVYTKGGHGYGMRPGPNPVSEWPARCGDWLSAINVMQPAAEK